MLINIQNISVLKEIGAYQCDKYSKHISVDRNWSSISIDRNWSYISVDKYPTHINLIDI